MFSIPITLTYVAPFFLLWFLAKNEIWSWLGGMAIISLTWLDPTTAPPASLIIGTVYCLKARQTGCGRFYVGSVVYLYMACLTIGWQGGTVPEPKIWLLIATCMILLLLAWRLRLQSALLALIPVILPAMKHLVPKSLLQWGALTIAVGFLALIAGIIVNLGIKSAVDSQKRV
jgi:hypothetical protein